MNLQPVAFSELPGWLDDDHGAAFRTFLSSCTQVTRTRPIGGRDSAAASRLRTLCMRARSGGALRGADARRFFEFNFVPHRVVRPMGTGILTGYYEPELEGSRTRTGEFQVPLYRQPADLVKLASDAMRGAAGDRLTAGRTVGGRIEPYFTRAEIENGALDGRGLEFLYLKDPIEAFILHVQGSGLVRLTDGSTIRIGYAAKNGYPYTSIGRLLIDRGKIKPDEMSLDVLQRWLIANRENGRALMQENKSFIFFREMTPAEAKRGTTGAQGVPLTDGRSLAVDTRYHTLGMPLYVIGPKIRHHGRNGFARLMIAQDVGSAIKGPERGDIFWGTGERAAFLAGETRHKGSFFVLLPRIR